MELPQRSNATPEYDLVMVVSLCSPTIPPQFTPEILERKVGVQFHRGSHQYEQRVCSILRHVMGKHEGIVTDLA
jgi:hypothetical protein